jgi:DEAD_2
VPEIEKALSELKRLMEYRAAHAETVEEKAKEQAFLGLGLTSRKNLCLNPEVCPYVSCPSAICLSLTLVTSGGQGEEGENR